jgi:hypothetical protein
VSIERSATLGPDRGRRRRGRRRALSKRSPSGGSEHLVVRVRGSRRRVRGKVSTDPRRVPMESPRGLARGVDPRVAGCSPGTGWATRREVLPGPLEASPRSARERSSGGGRRGSVEGRVGVSQSVTKSGRATTARRLLDDLAERLGRDRFGGRRKRLPDDRNGVVRDLRTAPVGGRCAGFEERRPGPWRRHLGKADRDPLCGACRRPGDTHARTLRTAAAGPSARILTGAFAVTTQPSNDPIER